MQLFCAVCRVGRGGAAAGARRARASPPRPRRRAPRVCVRALSVSALRSPARRGSPQRRQRARPVAAGAVVWPQGGLLSTHTRTHRTPTALNGTSTLGYFGVLTVLSSLCDTHTPQTRDRTSLALMLLSVLAQHAWSMGSG